jgi:hypothetical protein
MNVYTYYQPLAGFGKQVELINLWKKSWAQNGWKPVVIGSDQAQRDWKEFKRVLSAAEKLPTKNPRTYENNCYLRHLAMKNAGGGLMTDYDVMNYGFVPGDVPVKPCKDMLFLDPSKVPCALYGHSDAYAEICDKFVAASTGEFPIDAGHTSDMLIIMAGIYGEVKPVVVEFGAPGWEDAKLVHFSTSRVGSIAKARRDEKASLIKHWRPV